MLRELYFGAWASLGTLPLLQRAAIVVAVALILIWLIVKPLGAKILGLLLRLAELLVRGGYLVGAQVLAAALSRQNPDGYAQRHNRLAAWSERTSGRLIAWSKRMRGKHKAHLGKLLLLYLVLMLLIALPQLARPVVTENYLSYFSIVSEWYQDLERGVLERAKDYPPLFHSGPSDEKPEETAAPVWLTLSDRGWNGSNLREGPTEESAILTTLYGDIRVCYLGDQDGQGNEGWVHVRTEDGTVGWMHGSLLSAIPDSLET